MVWDTDRLKEIAERDKCTFDYKSLVDVKRDTKIIFVCGCGNEGCKAFRMLWENGGGFCKSCTRVNTYKKMCATIVRNHRI